MPPLTVRQYRRSFSIIEGITLVFILGLSVATVMAGKDLLKTAKLRQIITESKEYAWQMETFEAFYKGLPGDLKNARQLWPETADGDGNGFIESNGNGSETYRVWQQLTLTRLIEGQYDGTDQLPPSPLENRVSFRIEKQPNQVYQTQANSLNGIHLRSASGWHGAISPRDAQKIDTKMDDGIASSGKLVAYSDNKNGCTVTKNGTSASIDYSGVATYNTRKDEALCAMTYWVASK